jgi:hypothetical protein
MTLVLEIKPAAGRSVKAEVVVRGEGGRIIFTDRRDLASVEGRRKAAKDLCRGLRGKGIERAPDEMEKLLETKWNEALEAREREAAAAAAAAAAAPPSAAAEDVDGEAERLLAGMPEGVRAEASAVLHGPELLKRVVTDIDSRGVAGETELGATLYLVGISRLLSRPQSMRVKGPTSSGKSYVIAKVAGLAPPEAVIRATQMTPQALFHMRPGSLRHRWIVAGERPRKEDEDAAEATRALREMISSGRLSKLMPVKIGNELQTVLIEQEGPIAYVESTTRDTVFDEDENRCISLFTDERPEQTRRIIARLAEDSAGGGVRRDAGRVALVHHALQRMIRRRDVIVPYAVRLGELIPDQRVEARRAFPHLLTMIQASALLHQYQRQAGEGGAVIAGPDDYRIARRLLQGPMERLLGRGVGNPAKRFFTRLKGWFGGATFTSRDAKAKEETSRAAVYGWLSELHKAGHLEQVEAPRGATPAKWRLTDLDIEEATGDVLPSEKQVFEGGSC